jgi:uncharacterized protein
MTVFFDVNAIRPVRKLPIEAVARAVQPDHLHLILMPTEQCNFRCTYCYEDFEIGRMRPDVRQAVLNLIERRAPELRYLDVNWFGGEPLLARDSILEMGAKISILAQSYGFTFHSSMTTNGYLLSADLAAKLADIGVTHYQISLDGTAGSHDLTRVRRDGGGTFDRIWQNLIGLRDSAVDCAICLRVHVHPKNVSPVRDLASRLRRQFGGDPRFTVIFRPVEALGGPNDEHMEIFAHDAELDALLGDLAGSAGDLLSEDNHLDDYICYAARPNSLVVRADGRLGKCTVALQDPRNSIGHINPDGSLAIDQARLRPWLADLSTRDASFLECPLTSVSS